MDEQTECGLKDCHEDLGLGTQITFRVPELGNRTATIRVCDRHAYLVRGEPGSYSIGFTMQPLPATPFQKGTK